MQNRMRNHQMDRAGIDALLERGRVAAIATVGDDGKPYVVPIHYVYHDGALYFHGLPKGQKIDNIRANGAVSLTVHEMKSLLVEGETPCDVNTEYECVVVGGTAELLEDVAEKASVLRLIVGKYMPDMLDAPMPDSMVNGTAVVRVTISDVTGKYYP